MTIRLLAAAAAISVLSLPGVAMAAKPSCYDLWYARNAIYDENGYCFKSDLGKDVFDNDDCWTNSPTFSKKEWAMILAIKDEEDARGCHVN